MQRGEAKVTIVVRENGNRSENANATHSAADLCIYSGGSAANFKKPKVGKIEV